VAYEKRLLEVLRRINREEVELRKSRTLLDTLKSINKTKGRRLRALGRSTLRGLTG